MMRQHQAWPKHCIANFIKQNVTNKYSDINVPNCYYLHYCEIMLFNSRWADCHLKSIQLSEPVLGWSVLVHWRFQYHLTNCLFAQQIMDFRGKKWRLSHCQSSVLKPLWLLFKKTTAFENGIQSLRYSRPLGWNSDLLREAACWELPCRRPAFKHAHISGSLHACTVTQV